jgi:hypothetical protein
LGTCDNTITHVGVLSFFFSFYLFIWVTIKIDLPKNNKIIYKIKKHRVLTLGLRKKDDKHNKARWAFLEGKKDKSKFKIAY